MSFPVTALIKFLVRASPVDTCHMPGPFGVDRNPASGYRNKEYCILSRIGCNTGARQPVWRHVCGVNIIRHLTLSIWGSSSNGTILPVIILTTCFSSSIGEEFPLVIKFIRSI